MAYNVSIANFQFLAFTINLVNDDKDFLFIPVSYIHFFKFCLAVIHKHIDTVSFPGLKSKTSIFPVFQDSVTWWCTQSV